MSEEDRQSSEDWTEHDSQHIDASNDDEEEVQILSEEHTERSGPQNTESRRELNAMSAKKAPGRPKTSDIWDHFEVSDDNPSKAKCKYCDAQVC